MLELFYEENPYFVFFRVFTDDATCYSAATGSPGLFDHTRDYYCYYEYEYEQYSSTVVLGRDIRRSEQAFHHYGG